MRVLENKTTTILKTEDTNVTYADLLILLLNKPIQKNTTLKEMRQDMRLLDQLESAGEILEFSNDDYTRLKDLVDNSEWGIRHKDIIAFADDFDAATKEVKNDKAVVAE